MGQVVPNGADIALWETSASLVVGAISLSLAFMSRQPSEAHMPCVRGQLVRDVPVSLLDFSWSGCLVATNQPIDPGTVGKLRLDMGGKEYRDTVHIVRKTEHAGSSHAFTLGGQFGWGHRPSRASVRGEIPTIVTIP